MWLSLTPDPGPRRRDPRVNELMQEGCMYMRSPATYDKALGVFSQMIQLAPSYVEVC